MADVSEQCPGRVDSLPPFAGLDSGVPEYRDEMRWVLAGVGSVVGGAVGLFAPVVVGWLVGASGSYEVVVPFWLATVPLGVVGGAVLGFVLGRSR